MTNYTKGRQREYAAMKKLREEGYNCIRAAGSHGTFDIIAWNKFEIRMIQVKAKKYPTKEEHQKIEDELVPKNAKKELWVYNNGLSIVSF